MSIRTVLLTFTLCLRALATLLVGAISIWSLSGIVHNRYEGTLETAAMGIIEESSRFFSARETFHKASAVSEKSTISRS